MSRDVVVSDVQWKRITSSTGWRGRPFRDDRRVIEGIICRYRVGTPWRDVPHSFGGIASVAMPVAAAPSVMTTKTTMDATPLSEDSTR
ncbi:transposase [Williamsia sterculiae]|uniref:transposase n=1 Tax=Williamsia sterculiae TaxID=1344003 RepID=UPI0009FAFFA3